MSTKKERERGVYVGHLADFNLCKVLSHTHFGLSNAYINSLIYSSSGNSNVSHFGSAFKTLPCIHIHSSINLHKHRAGAMLTCPFHRVRCTLWTKPFE